MNSFKRVRAFQIELEFGSVGFEERGKSEYLEKNLSEQGKEPTTDSAHIWRRRRDMNPGHIGERRVLSPLRHPCSSQGIRGKRYSPSITPLVSFPCIISHIINVTCVKKNPEIQNTTGLPLSNQS